MFPEKGVRFPKEKIFWKRRRGGRGGGKQEGRKRPSPCLNRRFEKNAIPLGKRLMRGKGNHQKWDESTGRKRGFGTHGNGDHLQAEPRNRKKETAIGELYGGKRPVSLGERGRRRGGERGSPWLGYDDC